MELTSILPWSISSEEEFTAWKTTRMLLGRMFVAGLGAAESLIHNIGYNHQGLHFAQTDAKPPRSLIRKQGVNQSLRAITLIFFVSIDFDHPLEETKHDTIVDLGV
jgi:hypothetical protein